MSSNSFFVIRHGLTDHNVFKQQLLNLPEYTDFHQSFLLNPYSSQTKAKAIALRKTHRYDTADKDIPLHDLGICDIKNTAKNLVLDEGIPDLIICSPYLRTRQTLSIMKETVPELCDIETQFDCNVREQDFGDMHYFITYNIYFAHHKNEHKKFLNQDLDYACPNGESVNSMTYGRITSFVDNKICTSKNKVIWVITHYSALLSIRKILEHLTDEQYGYYNKIDTPKNCGVTKYALYVKYVNRYKCIWYNKCYH